MIYLVEYHQKVCGVSNDNVWRHFVYHWFDDHFVDAKLNFWKTIDLCVKFLKEGENGGFDPSLREYVSRGCELSVCQRPFSKVG